MILSFNHDHREFWVFHKVPALGIEYLETDAAVAAKSVLLLHSHLHFDILRGPDSYLLRLNEGAAFTCTARKVEEAHD